MNIFQNNRKIGFSHSRLQPTDTGYELEEKVVMRINTMGMIQDLHLQTRARLNRDLALERFEFGIESGRFRFSAQGEASGGVLSVRTEAAGDRRSIEVPVPPGITPAAAVIDALAMADLKPGNRYTFDVFDPAALAQIPVLVEVIGPEDVPVMGQSVPATKVTLNFRGMLQTAWIGENGDLLKERGLLGMRLEKTSRADALDDLGLAASQDLTELASITPNRPIASPEALEVLRVAIGGATTEGLQLQGGRQRVSDGVLTVRKESLEELPDVLTEQSLPALERVYLKPEPFIQSDHAKIRAQVRSILGDNSHNAAAPEGPTPHGLDPRQHRETAGAVPAGCRGHSRQPHGRLQRARRAVRRPGAGSRDPGPRGGRRCLPARQILLPRLEPAVPGTLGHGGCPFRPAPGGRDAHPVRHRLDAAVAGPGGAHGEADHHRPGMTRRRSAPETGIPQAAALARASDVL